MNEPDIAAVLAAIRPGEQFTLNGNDYSQLVWLSDSPIPSASEIDSAWPSVRLKMANVLVEQRRASAYREEADPLFFKWQSGEGTQAEWEAKRAEIRERHPYMTDGSDVFTGDLL